MTDQGRLGVVVIPPHFSFPHRFGDGKPGTCQACGCTDGFACAGGCAWETDERNLCTACSEGVLGIVNPPKRDAALVQKAIEGASQNVLALAHQLAQGDWRRAMIGKAMT